MSIVNSLGSALGLPVWAGASPEGAEGAVGVAEATGLEETATAAALVAAGAVLFETEGV